MLKRITLNPQIHFGKPCALTVRFLGDLGHDGILDTQVAVHAELARVLSLHTEPALARAFVVTEADRHRIRRLPEAENESN